MPLLSLEKGRAPWLRWLPFALFVALGTAYFWNARGDDLASSYVGCRVLAAGYSSSLYSYDPVNFASIADNDAPWQLQAASGGYGSYLHPYVQTPLWAWALQPLCAHARWPSFEHLFLVLSLASIAGFVYLTARYWTPRLNTPMALAIVLLLLAFSEPFLFAMVLVQTHALLLLLAVAGLILAERERPFAAGFCVACAAAVKITPGVLVLYWLAARRWRAALSFIGWSVLLLAMTRLTAGAALFHAYLDDMHRVSDVLLVAENNQSLASWWMARFFPPDEVFDVNAYVLPHALKLLSLACMAGTSLLGGWLDRRKPNPVDGRIPAQNTTPFGAGIALVAMTIFAPIAWTHYFIVLAIPLMMLTSEVRSLSSVRWRLSAIALLVMVAALLYRPLAPDVIRMDLSDYAVLRGSFYAGIMCLAGCLSASLARGWKGSRDQATVPLPGTEPLISRPRHTYRIARLSFMLLLVSLAPRSARAFCSAPQLKVSDEFFVSSLVIQGEVLASRDELDPQDNDSITGTLYRVRVDRLLRGSTSKAISVYSENTTGRFPMQVKQHYVLFLSRTPDGKWVVDNCGNSGPVPQRRAVLEQLTTLPLRHSFVYGEVFPFSGRMSCGPMRVIVRGRSSAQTTVRPNCTFQVELPPGTYSATVDGKDGHVAAYELSYKDPYCFTVPPGGSAGIAFRPFDGADNLNREDIEKNDAWDRARCSKGPQKDTPELH